MTVIKLQPVKFLIIGLRILPVGPVAAGHSNQATEIKLIRKPGTAGQQQTIKETIRIFHPLHYFLDWVHLCRL